MHGPLFQDHHWPLRLTIRRGQIQSQSKLLITLRHQLLEVVHLRERSFNHRASSLIIPVSTYFLRGAALFCPI